MNEVSETNQLCNKEVRVEFGAAFCGCRRGLRRSAAGPPMAAITKRRLFNIHPKPHIYHITWSIFLRKLATTDYTLPPKDIHLGLSESKEANEQPLRHASRTITLTNLWNRRVEAGGMPVQPPFGALKAATRLSTATANTRQSFQQVTQRGYAFSVNMDSGKLQEDQTWRPSSGIVFGSNSSTPTQEIELPPREASEPVSSKTLSSWSHSSGTPTSLVSLGDDGLIRRRQPTRASKVAPNTRELSQYAASQIVSDTQSIYETTSMDTFHREAYLTRTRSRETADLSRKVDQLADRTRKLTAKDEGTNSSTKIPLDMVPEWPLPYNFTPLFVLPEDRLQNAREANENWEYGMYLNSTGKKPIMHYCRTFKSSEDISRLFLDEGTTILGFDLEWKAHNYYRRGGGSSGSIKDNVSLIQLASESRVALFHIALHRGTTVEELLAPSLRAILESPRIVKAGVNINADCTRIQAALGATVRARCELSHLHKLVRYAATEPAKVNRKLVALDTLVEEHLGLRLFKGDDVRTGTWERELAMDQMRYAASDAYAGLQLFRELDAKRRALAPPQPMPAPAEMRVPICVNAVDGHSDGAASQTIVLAQDEECADEEE